MFTAYHYPTGHQVSSCSGRISNEGHLGQGNQEWQLCIMVRAHR